MCGKKSDDDIPANENDNNNKKTTTLIQHYKQVKPLSILFVRGRKTLFKKTSTTHLSQGNSLIKCSLIKGQFRVKSECAILKVGHYATMKTT